MLAWKVVSILFISLASFAYGSNQDATDHTANSIRDQVTSDTLFRFFHLIKHQMAALSRQLHAYATFDPLYLKAEEASKPALFNDQYSKLCGNLLEFTELIYDELENENKPCYVCILGRVIGVFDLVFKYPGSKIGQLIPYIMTSDPIKCPGNCNISLTDEFWETFENDCQAQYLLAQEYNKLNSYFEDKENHNVQDVCKLGYDCFEKGDCQCVDCTLEAKREEVMVNNNKLLHKYYHSLGELSLFFQEVANDTKDMMKKKKRVLVPRIPTNISSLKISVKTPITPPVSPTIPGKRKHTSHEQLENADVSSSARRKRKRQLRCQEMYQEKANRPVISSPTHKAVNRTTGFQKKNDYESIYIRFKTLHQNVVILRRPYVDSGLFGIFWKFYEMFVENQEKQFMMNQQNIQAQPMSEPSAESLSDEEFESDEEDEEIDDGMAAVENFKF